MKRYYFVAGVLIIALALSVWQFFILLTPKTLTKTTEQGGSSINTASTSVSEIKMAVDATSSLPTLSFGSTTIAVYVADTPQKQKQGLSGRASLSPNTGMLFIFDTNDRWGIWMKDMNFSIDILWFDQNFRVVTIKENATPESYPEVFVPTSGSRYVLEVPAGFVSSHNIKIGERMTFSKK